MLAALGAPPIACWRGGCVQLGNGCSAGPLHSSWAWQQVGGQQQGCRSRPACKGRRSCCVGEGCSGFCLPSAGCRAGLGGEAGSADPVQCQGHQPPPGGDASRADEGHPRPGVRCQAQARHRQRQRCLHARAQALQAAARTEVRGQGGPQRPQGLRYGMGKAGVHLQIPGLGGPDPMCALAVPSPVSLPGLSNAAMKGGLCPRRQLESLGCCIRGAGKGLVPSQHPLCPDELTVPRYRTEKPSKSPPPPPPRRSFPSSHGLTTTRSGEVIITSKKEPGFMKVGSGAMGWLLGWTE